MKTAPELVDLLRFFLTLQSWWHCQALLTVTPFLWEKIIHPCISQYFPLSLLFTFLLDK